MVKHRGALAENIALLGQLGKTVTDPTVQKTSILLQGKEDSYSSNSRLLSLEQEQRTAEAFALLLATSDDSNTVGAVCVEEHTDGSGFVVRTAVNSGSQKERMDTFRRLVSAARLSSGTPPFPDQVLTEIVSTSQSRLLCRLRSKHVSWSRRAKGPPIIKQLQKFAELAKSQQFQEMQQAITDLTKTFDALERLSLTDANSSAGCILLTDILLKVSDWNFPELEEFLSIIPPKDSPWSSTPYIRVVRKFMKLAQYVSAGRHLQRMVQRFPTWKIQEVVKGPFTESSAGAEPDGVAGLFTRMMNHSTAKKRKQFVRNLETRIGKNQAWIEQTIDASASATSRVHAEIQLLYHYEQDQALRLRPRVLCSNKEACYLCYLFITTHAGFHTQRSHGNLYVRWRLPRFNELQLPKKSKHRMNQTIARFNQSIEAKILNEIVQKFQKRPDPSESSVFLSGIYTPSVVSSKKKGGKPHMEELVASPSLEHHLNVPETSSTKPPAVSESTKSICSATSQILEAMNTAPSQPAVEQVSQSSPSAPLDASISTNYGHTKLALGEGPFFLSQARPMHVKVSKHSVARFYAPKFFCEFVYGDVSDEVKGLSIDHVAIILRVEWLSDDIATLYNAQNGVTNVLTLSSDSEKVVEQDVFGQLGLILSANGSTIMLRVVQNIF